MWQKKIGNNFTSGEIFNKNLLHCDLFTYYIKNTGVPYGGVY